MWIPANLFCNDHSLGLRNLQKKAKKATKKILLIDTKIFSYQYTKGIGRGGKTLYLWSKPLSEEEARLVEMGFKIEDICEALQDLKKIDRQRQGQDLQSEKANEVSQHLHKTQEQSNGALLGRSLEGEMKTRQDEALQGRDLQGEKSKNSRDFQSEVKTQHDDENSHRQNFIGKKIDIQGQDLQGFKDRELSLQSGQIKQNEGEVKGKNLRAYEKYKQAQKIQEASLQKEQNLPQSSKQGEEAKGLLEDLTGKAHILASQQERNETNSTQNFTRLSPFAKASFKKQNEAVQKANIIKQWQRAKKSLKAKEFITLVNANKMYSFKLSENKLFAWQRAFEAQGLDGLIDKRTSTKQNKITQLGLEELFESVLLAQKGRLNISNIHRIMNYEMASRGELELGDFLAKKDEFVSYEAVLSMSKKYLKKNKLIKNLLLYGEDGAISRHLPALGRANWAVNSVNEIVEIDASPLDAICKIDEMAVKLKIDKELLQEWQKRYTLISLIDTYSGVVSFHLSFAEDSVGIARAIAKYISTYGKPKCIHCDNGKAFLSKHTKALLERLEITYKAMPAYSGWAKPYVENKFKALQNSLTANLIGYIGANVSQREAIEFFFSKKERRLKKGAKTHQKRLQNLEYMQECIDTYSQYFMNNSFLDRLGKSPKEAYEQCKDKIEMIDSLSLSLYLGGALQKRKILSKGVSLNGGFFYNPVLFQYEQIFVCENLNNTQELFCFDEEKNFICVANSLDLEQGVSVEEAKAARKLVTRAIKANKDKITKARYKLEDDMQRYLALGKEKLSKIENQKPKISEKIANELEASKRLVGNGEHFNKMSLQTRAGANPQDFCVGKASQREQATKGRVAFSKSEDLKNPYFLNPDRIKKQKLKPSWENAAKKSRKGVKANDRVGAAFSEASKRVGVAFSKTSLRAKFG